LLWRKKVKSFDARRLVYFMTNKRDGILYVGVTSNLPRRAFEHRQGLIAGFTKRYGLKRLVYCEHHSDIRYAIQREKTIKHWRRAWKVRLIHGVNPEWDDLYKTLVWSPAAIKYRRHGRACPGHPRLPRRRKVVDARHKAGHDE
jgi:putative endonuclease